MDTVQVLAALLQMAFSYIFVSVLTSGAQKQTVTDLKTDLRTTKEDLMSGLKITEEQIINQIKESKVGSGNDENV